MSIYYEYDFRTKNVLIRKLDKDSPPEILHKGDEKWEILAPRLDYKDESYCRAIYLGQGCWEDLERITEEKAEEILKQWGYTENPPSAQ